MAHRIFLASCGIFCCVTRTLQLRHMGLVALRHVDLSSLTRDRTHVSCKMDSWLLGHQGSPSFRDSACHGALWLQIFPWLMLFVLWGFPGGSAGKECTCNMSASSLIPGLGRSAGEGHGNPLQNSCLENSAYMSPPFWESFPISSRTYPSAQTPHPPCDFLFEGKEELDVIYFILSELNIIGSYLFHSFIPLLTCLSDDCLH